MLLLEFTLLLLFVASIGVALAPRVHVPTELFLLIVTLAASLIPGLPRIALDPDYVFFLLMPPVLFAAAYFTSWRDFRMNLRPIALLSVGLVIFTMVAIGYLLHLCFPVVPLGAAFLLGAIVSPPDAAAATAIGKKVGLPRRLLTIIEGESLVNDATALVCYRFALAAIGTGTFSLQAATFQFFQVAFGGALCGYLLAVGVLALIKQLNNSTAETLMTFTTCFLSYVIAERLHLSGVVSTVVAGLAFGRSIPRITSAETRMEAAGAWNVMLLAVNGVIFALIGFQLPSVLRTVSQYPLDQILRMTALVIGMLIALRFVWVFVANIIRRLVPHGLRAEGARIPSWRALVILSWTGMRGIVSLAAALAIPLTLPSGELFPHRDLIIFLAYAVILFTLILPTITLPLLVKQLQLKSGGENEVEETRARLLMAQAASGSLDSGEVKSRFDDRLISEHKNRYSRFLGRLAPNLQPAAFSSIDPVEQQNRKLVFDLLRTERSQLLRLREAGELHDEVFHRLSDELDLEEVRMRRNVRP